MDAKSGDSRMDSGAFLVEEERRLEEIWSDRDRQAHRERIRGFDENIGRIRSQIEAIRVQTDTLWDHFVSLALEKIMKQHLRKFLGDVQVQAAALTPQLANVSSGIDGLIASIAEYQRFLDRKAGILETMAHRISTQNHLNMMLTRLVGLESYLLGKKHTEEDTDPNLPRKRETTVPSDLLYLGVRLRTTRSAVMASRKSRQVTDIGSELQAPRYRAERLRTDLAVIAARMACLNDQAEYWRAFLEMPDDAAW